MRPFEYGLLNRRGTLCFYTERVARDVRVMEVYRRKYMHVFLQDTTLYNGSLRYKHFIDLAFYPTAVEAIYIQ